MSVRVSQKEINRHLVRELEPQHAAKAAAVRYEMYVDLVYHLTASPHDYEELLIDTEPQEEGLVGIEYLLQAYPHDLLLAARDVIEYSMQVCGFNELPDDEDTTKWRQLEEHISQATVIAHLDDVAEHSWLRDPRGAPDPFLNRLSIKRLYLQNRPVPLEELLGRRSLHPDVQTRLEVVEKT